MTLDRQASTSSASSSTIDVRIFVLDLPEAAAARLAALLSPDERQRAERLIRPQDGARFRAAHGRLREILAHHLAVAPQEIVFGEEPNGKPYIAAPETPLRFNLTHSDALAAVAVSPGVAVGVDIERIKPLEGTGLENALSPGEQKALAALGGSERRDAFYRCWTRKEALLKAHGGGLSVPLDSFDVPVGDQPGGVILRFGGGTTDVDQISGAAGDRIWRVVSFTPAPGYAGAVAVAADASGRHAEPHWRAWPQQP